MPAIAAGQHRLGPTVRGLAPELRPLRSAPPSFEPGRRKEPLPGISRPRLRYLNRHPVFGPVSGGGWVPWPPGTLLVACRWPRALVAGSLGLVFGVLPHVEALLEALWVTCGGDKAARDAPTFPPSLFWAPRKRGGAPSRWDPARRRPSHRIIICRLRLSQVSLITPRLTRVSPVSARGPRVGWSPVARGASSFLTTLRAPQEGAAPLDVPPLTPGNGGRGWR